MRFQVTFPQFYHACHSSAHEWCMLVLIGDAEGCATYLSEPSMLLDIARPLTFHSQSIPHNIVAPACSKAPDCDLLSFISHFDHQAETGF